MTSNVLGGVCPTCGSLPYYTCVTQGGQPCPPHAARKGVTVNVDVARFQGLLVDELSALGGGALHANDMSACITAALLRFSRGESAT